jgi:hypothetical protein
LYFQLDTSSAKLSSFHGPKVSWFISLSQKGARSDGNRQWLAGSAFTWHFKLWKDWLWHFVPYITVSVVTLRCLCCIIYELFTFHKAFFSHLRKREDKPVYYSVVCSVMPLLDTRRLSTVSHLQYRASVRRIYIYIYTHTHTHTHTHKVPPRSRTLAFISLYNCIYICFTRNSLPSIFALLHDVQRIKASVSMTILRSVLYVIILCVYSPMMILQGSKHVVVFYFNVLMWYNCERQILHFVRFCNILERFHFK